MVLAVNVNIKETGDIYISTSVWRAQHPIAGQFTTIKNLVFFYLEETSLVLELVSQSYQCILRKRVPYKRLTIYPNR